MFAQVALVAALAAAAADLAWAQDEAPAAAPSQAEAAISQPQEERSHSTSASTLGWSDDVRNAHLYGATELSVQYNDNYFFTPGTPSLPRTSSTGVLLKPTLNYTTAAPRLRFQSGIWGSFGMFNLKGTADDYYDYGGSAGILWQPADRQHVAYNMAVKRGHDPFGTDRTENTPLEDRSLDKWTRETYNLLYRYSTPRARYDLEARAFVINENYYTNQVSASYLDYDTQGLDLTAFYNYSPKTKALLNVIGQHINFPTNCILNVCGDDRSGNEYRVRVGMRWLATAKTSGDFRVGYVARDFDSQRSTFHGLDWLVSLAWAPTTYRLFTLNSGRADIRSYTGAGFIDVRYVGLGWREEWTRLFVTQLKLSYNDARFVGTPRNDRGFGGSLRADYRLLEYLGVFAGYDYRSRSSDPNSLLDYHQNAVYGGVRVTY